jgi:hypothetical protein
MVPKTTQILMVGMMLAAGHDRLLAQAQAPQACVALEAVLTQVRPLDCRTPAIVTNGMARNSQTRCPRRRIVLEIDVRLPLAVQRLAVDEAAQIWAPYGVEVSGQEASSGGLPGNESTVLRVQIAAPIRDPMPLSSPFGSLRFVAGIPESTVLLHYDALTRSAAGVAFGGVRDWQRPPALRDRVLGRITGRIIAHEIGHFVLRSPRHASHGLMRPSHYITELMSWDRGLFALTQEDVSLLRAAISRSDQDGDPP